MSGGSYSAAVANMVSSRVSSGRPVVCQQAGTENASDPTGSILASNLELLRQASGGSIGWTFWEKVSSNNGSQAYGPWWDASDGTGRHLASLSRLSAIQQALSAPAISP